jgi:hypothetical protein
MFAALLVMLFGTCALVGGHSHVFWRREVARARYRRRVHYRGHRRGQRADVVLLAAPTYLEG